MISPPMKIDICIGFVVVNSAADDNEREYIIDLSPEEQERMYARLDEQCRGFLRKGCEELLAEARVRMEGDMA